MNETKEKIIKACIDNGFPERFVDEVAEMFMSTLWSKNHELLCPEMFKMIKDFFKNNP